MTEIPFTLLTDFVVAGECVYIRTHCAAPLVEQRPLASGAER